MNDSKKFFEIAKRANFLRLDTLDMCVRAGTGHITSCMSCAEILATLYHGNVINHDPSAPDMPNRDRFILSKGQASPILYKTLENRGFFPREQSDLFVKGKDGSGKGAPFGVHLQCTVPGVEFTTGSLGYGLGYAAGMAEASRIDGRNNFVFVLLGDGELYEGSNWESAMYASHHKLDNLIAIVDRNGMCTNDYTEKLVGLEPLSSKWSSFGWECIDVNGHSVRQLYNAFSYAKSSKGKPHVVIARTTKGQGIKSMVGKLYLHGVTPSGQAAELARKELVEFTSNHEKAGWKYE